MALLHESSISMRILGAADIAVMLGSAVALAYMLETPYVLQGIGITCVAYWAYKAKSKPHGYRFPVIFGMGKDGKFSANSWFMMFNWVVMSMMVTGAIEGMVYGSGGIDTVLLLLVTVSMARILIPQIFYDTIIKRMLKYQDNA